MGSRRSEINTRANVSWFEAPMIDLNSAKELIRLASISDEEIRILKRFQGTKLKDTNSIPNS